MPSEPKNPQHWPFSDSTTGSDNDASFRAALEGKRAREAAQAATDQRNSRNNRLIVGGRAHNKKHGLS